MKTKVNFLPEFQGYYKFTTRNGRLRGFFPFTRFYRKRREIEGNSISHALIILSLVCENSAPLNIYKR